MRTCLIATARVLGSRENVWLTRDREIRSAGTDIITTDIIPDACPLRGRAAPYESVCASIDPYCRELVTYVQ